MAEENCITKVVKFGQKFISGTSEKVVDASALHTYLGVSTKYQDWIIRRIEEYGFRDNSDYLMVAEKKSGRGRPKKTYWLTLDMAKELSMIEKTDKGREARKYFLQCEKAAKEALQLSTQQKLLQPVARTIQSAKVVLYWSDGVIDHEDFSEEAVNYTCKHLMPKSVLLDHQRVTEALRPIQEGMAEGLSLWAEMGEIVEGRNGVQS